ncbi:hypothetical protein ES703_18412 [subsurface metagenome]
MVIAVLPIIGGIYALKRMEWRWALTGSICSAIGFLCAVFEFYIIFLGVSYIYAWFGVLGIPAIIFTALSKDEFE